MDSIFSQKPRFTPPRPPAPVHVRSSSREAALDALEYGPTIPHARIGELTDLGETTLRHAIRQLSREGVLTPQSGRYAATISVARYPVLPILEVTPRHLIWRLCDTLGQSVFATIRDRGKFRPLEDDFTALMGQASTIMSGGACGLSKTVPIQPPALLCPNGRDFEQLSLLLPLMPPPTAILPPEEAAAMELRFLPTAKEAEAILLIHMGEETSIPRITLFSRRVSGDRSTPFVPSPMASDLTQALLAYIGNHPPRTSVWWKQCAAFLADLCRFIRLQCVVFEADRPAEKASLLRASLPPDVKLVRARYALNTPSLAHRGALRVIRRALWKSMEEDQLP